MRISLICCWLLAVAASAPADETPYAAFSDWVADLERRLAEASAGEGAGTGTLIDWDKALPVLESVKDRVRFTSKVRRVRWKDGVLSIDVSPLQPLGGPRGAISGPVGRWIEVTATKDQARAIEVGDPLKFEGVISFQQKQRRGDARPKDAQLLLNVGSRSRTVGWLVSADFVVSVSGQELVGKDASQHQAP